MKPFVRISEDGEKYLRKGQMWMYRNNLIELDESIENGAVVEVLTVHDEYLGTGFLSKQSHITVRILTKNTNEELNKNFFKEKIKFVPVSHMDEVLKVALLKKKRQGFEIPKEEE